jgi:phasin
MDAVIERKTKETDSSTAFPSFDMPKFGFPKMEIPDGFRDLVEQSTTQAKDFYQKARTATEEANSLLASTYATAAKGTMNYNLKVVEMAKINRDATFNYVRALFGVTDFSQLIKLSTDHAREQMATLTEQAKVLTALAQETVSRVSEPVKAEVKKTLNKA